jgi:hypothetical protein
MQELGSASGAAPAGAAPAPAASLAPANHPAPSASGQLNGGNFASGSGSGSGSTGALQQASQPLQRPPSGSAQLGAAVNRKRAGGQLEGRSRRARAGQAADTLCSGH